jgi:hypothetical protein
LSLENHKDKEPFWRKQYEYLITLQYQEANRFWIRFQISLALNGALLIAFSALIGEDSEKVSFTAILGPSIISIVGIALSIIWKKIIKAGQLWQDYWVKKGIELENKYYNELGIKIFSDMPNYENKAPVRKLRNYIPIIFLITWSILTIVSLLVIFSIYGYSLDKLLV